MRASFKQLALLFLGLASQGIAMASPPTDSINADPKSLFAVNINNEVLGPLRVSGTGAVAIIDPSPPIQSFTIDPKTHFLLAPLTGSPPASVSFTQGAGSSCGPSGPLVFVNVDDDPCSRQPNWLISPDHEVAITNFDGFFEICEGNQVFFSTTSTAGCTEVRFITQFGDA